MNSGGRMLVMAGWSLLGSLAGCTTARMSLDDTLKPYLAAYELPSVAAAVVQDGKIVAAGAVGTRRLGMDIPVTLDDRYHLGSDTKAMTALLAAMLVEEGKLNWQTTLAEAFPELAATMDPKLKTVTLEQLLSHTSGISPDTEEIGLDYFQESLKHGENLDEMRYWMVTKWSRKPLVSEPGTCFAYANLNYLFVGAMIERLEKKSWDEVVTERIFIPLGLQTAGLGGQATLGRVDAPLGHEMENGTLSVRLAGPHGDNPEVLGPAGIAHMSVLDFARWAGWNAGEGRRGPLLVRPETLRKLHTPVVSMSERKEAAPGTPPGGRYALGWGELAPAWAPHPLLYHGGSNGMNLALIWLDPQQDFAMVMLTNAGGDKANKALNTLTEELYRKFAPGQK